MSAFEGVGSPEGWLWTKIKADPELERAFDDFAGVDRRMIDRAALVPLVLDQCILAIQKEYMELLDFAVGDLRIAIVDQCVARCDQGAAMQFCPHKSKRHLAN
jgi:hypothetical protein